MPTPTPQTSSSFSKTIQKGIELSPETKALENSAAQRIEQGQTAEEAALATRQGVEQRAKFASSALGQQAGREYESDVSRMHADLAAKRAPIDAAIADLSTKRIDPNHFFAEKGTGGRIALALAQMFGAAGAAVGHTSNFAAEYIKNAVDRDVHAQEANIENAKGDVANKMAAYRLVEGSAKDKLEETQHARVLKLAAAQQQIADAAQSANDPIERAKAMQLHGQVGMQLAGERAKLDEMQAGKVTTTSHSTTTSGGAGAAGTGGVPTDRMFRGPDGRMYLANDPKDAQEIQRASAQSQQIQRDVAKIRALRDAGGQFPMGDTRAKLEEAVASLRGHWMDMHQKRMPPDMLKAQADAAIGDPSSMFDWHAPARLDALLQSVNGNVASDMQAYGARPLDPGAIAIVGGKPVYQAPNIPVVTPTRGKK